MELHGSLIEDNNIKTQQEIHPGDEQTHEMYVLSRLRWAQQLYLFIYTVHAYKNILIGQFSEK